MGYSLHEQFMGNTVDSPSLEEVLHTFYANMRKKALKGAPYIELVDPRQAEEEANDYWHQIETHQITLPELNQELAKRFGGNDLNSVFEPVLEPMNRAGFCFNLLGGFHGKVNSHDTHLGLVEKTI